MRRTARIPTAQERVRADWVVGRAEDAACGGIRRWRSGAVTAQEEAEEGQALENNNRRLGQLVTGYLPSGGKSPAQLGVSPGRITRAPWSLHPSLAAGHAPAH